MLIKKNNDIPSSEITPRSAYLNRRNFMAGAAALGVAGMLDPQRALADGGAKLQTVKSPLSTSGLTPTSFKDITSYNNFYEFGVEKDEPSKNAGRMKTRPWTLTIDGLVKEKKKVGIEQVLSLADRGEGLPSSLCGGLEHGDSLGRLFPLGIDQVG